MHRERGSNSDISENEDIAPSMSSFRITRGSHKQISALNPIDMLNHDIRVGTDELPWAIDNFIQAHS